MCWGLQPLSPLTAAHLCGRGGVYNCQNSTAEGLDWDGQCVLSIVGKCVPVLPGLLPAAPQLLGQDPADPELMAKPGG